jgi:hypothetical protein
MADSTALQKADWKAGLKAAQKATNSAGCLETRKAALLDSLLVASTVHDSAGHLEAQMAANWE